MPTPDEIFEMLRPIARGVAATFGRDCEVILHDYRDPTHSIVEVAGDVTHRHVGGSISAIGLRMVSLGHEAQDELNYITRTEDGRVLKSTTILLRDGDGHVFGAMCINFNVTEMRMWASALSQLVGGTTTKPDEVKFSDDIGSVIRAVIDEEELRIGRPIDRLHREDRMRLFKALDARGIFALRGAVTEVSSALGVSRATTYNYLKDARGSGDQA